MLLDVIFYVIHFIINDIGFPAKNTEKIIRNFFKKVFESFKLCVYLHPLTETTISFISPAGVVKLVDTPDLGSGASRCVGSSPITRTKKPLKFQRLFFYLYQLLFFNYFRILRLAAIN